MSKKIRFTGFLLQKNPAIFSASIPGKWLLKHATPSWRMSDPLKGFQRVVKEKRSRQIAVAVLDQQRTFPNSIVLATDKNIVIQENTIEMSDSIKFLVVDGQHRLWAQHFCQYEAMYSCNIHSGLSETDMARLFLEINDNQKRVPSSLRWDLVRLVRPKDDHFAIAAAELVFAFSENSSSPLYQRIDLTGEQKEISLKQGSIAPELKYIISKPGALKSLNFEAQYDVIERYFTAIKSLDTKGWNDASSPFYQARTLRMLIKILPEIVAHKKTDPTKLTVSDFRKYLSKINAGSLSVEKIRAKQGAAGMKEIYNEIKAQIF